MQHRPGLPAIPPLWYMVAAGGDGGWRAPSMKLKRRLRWVGGIVAVLAIVLVAIAPSWRNYYLPRRTVRVVADQLYVAGSTSPRHRLDLYLPTTGARPWPVVVFVHGGYWRPFDRRLFQPFTGLHGCVGVALANREVLTAVVSYRQFRDASSMQDPLDDIAHAVRWVIDHAAAQGGDPSRVYVVGHSAGGFMTALLALEPEHLQRAGVEPRRVRGFVSLAGVYDLQRLAHGIGSSLAPVVRASAPTAEAVERFSPYRHVEANHPPMLLGIGDDEPVTREEYRRMLAALSANGGDVRGFEAPGEGHMDLVMHLSRPGSRVLAEIVRFIDAHP